MEEKWITSACPTANELLDFHETRLKSLTALLIQSAHSIQRIEKEMMNGDEKDIEIVDQTLLFDELQQQLTSVQVQCLGERRNYLGLVGDTEQLKLENEDLRRKFHAAMLLGRIDEKAVCHFLQKNPKAPNLTDKIIRITDEMKKCDGEKTTKYDLQNPVVLVQQVAFLEKHLEEVKEQHFLEVHTLKETLKHSEEERDLMRTHFESRLKGMANRLHDSRAMVHKTAEDNLQFQKRMLLSEEDWTKEHKALVHKLAQASETALVPYGGGSSSSICGEYHHVHRHKDLPALQKQLLEKLSRAEIQLLEKQNTLKEYEMKFVQMERKMQRIKDEEAETKRAYMDAVKKLKLKNDTLEKRFDKIDERRKLDNEGFRQDVKSLKQFISSIDKKLHLFMFRSTSNNRLQENSAVPSILPEDCSGKFGEGTMSRIDVHGVNIGDVLKPKASKTNSRGGVLKPLNSVQNRRVKKAVSKGSSQTEEEVITGDSSTEDVERDRLVYQMLCKVLRSAQNQVDKVEECLIGRSAY